MSKEKNIRWLYQQLPELIQKGIITAAQAEQVQKHFGELDERPAYNWAFIIASSLGAILIGGGIIMLFAYNWESFSQGLRTFLSFLPLVIAQIIYAYVFFKKKDKVAWVESNSAFLMLSLAATISLISQTYHMMGSLEEFLFVWMLLSIPLMYLMNSSLVTVFYLIGIASWAVNQSGSTSVYYWGFLLAAIPHFYNNINPRSSTARANALAWFLVTSLAFAWFAVLEMKMSAYLLLATSVGLSLFYLLGQQIFPKGKKLVAHPFMSFATGGVFIMTTILGYDWPNKWISLEEVVYGQRYETWAGLINFSVFIIIIAAYFFLVFRAIKEGKLKNYFIVFFPMMVFVGMLLVKSGWEFGAIALANLFMLALGIFYIKAGIKQHKLSLINLGMLFLTATIVARFFDADVSLVLKGVVFILLGIGFLMVNVVLSKKIKAEGHQ